MLCALSTIGSSIKANKTQFETNMTSSQYYIYDSLSLDKQMEIVNVYDSKIKYNNYMSFICKFLSSEPDPITKFKKVL